MRSFVALVLVVASASPAFAWSKAEKQVRRSVDRVVRRIEEEPGGNLHVPRLRKAVHRALRSGTLTMVEGRSVRGRTAMIEPRGGGAAAMIEAKSSPYPGGAASVDVIVPEPGGGATTLRVKVDPREGLSTEETFSLKTRVPWRTL